MENEVKKPLELYIHIPFCVKNAITVISFPDLQEKRGSVNISRLWKGDRCCSGFFGQEITTVFIGGGTPSVPDPSLVGEILDQIRNKFYGPGC